MQTQYSINSYLCSETELSLLLALLKQQTHWQEHALIKQFFPLINRQVADFHDELALYQQHFCLFNALYRLIERKLPECNIQIELCRIEVSQQTQHWQPDAALFAYYLNENMLIATDRAEILRLKQAFIDQFQRYLIDGKPQSQKKIIDQNKFHSPITNKQKCCWYRARSS